jgi:hypothetical protein
VPAPADFGSATPGSAWFVRRVPGQPVVECLTDGSALLGDVQHAVSARLREIGRADLAAALVVDPSARGWDAPLVAGVRALLARYNTGGRLASFVAALDADAAAQRVGDGVLRPAIWLAFLDEGRTSTGATVHGQGSPAEVDLVAPYTPPPWGRPIPPLDGRLAGTLTGLVCRPITQARPPAPPPAPPAQPGKGLDALLAYVTIFVLSASAAVATADVPTYVQEREALERRRKGGG